MKEVEFPYIDDIAMFRTRPFHPITKSPVIKSERLDCTMERKYGTGMILCKEKTNAMKLFFTILASIAITTACVLLFSLEVEVKHLSELPLVYFLLANIHVVFVIAMISIIVIVIVVKRTR